MIFSHLPEDILVPILARLNAHALVKLNRTGDRQLGLVVRRNMRNLDIQLRGFSQFPFSAYDDPRVASLEVTMISTDSKYPLNCLNRPIVPSVALNSLVKLKFQFSNCFSVFDNMLATNAPNLETLICLDYYARWSPYWMDKLPVNIKKLTLKSGCLPKPMPIHEIARLLPRSLESLFVSFLQLKVSIPDKDGDVAVDWPQNLKRIVVFGLPIPGIFEHAPPNIEVLRGAYRDKGELRLSMALAPRKWRKLRIMGLEHLCHYPFTADARPAKAWEAAWNAYNDSAKWYGCPPRCFYSRYLAKTRQ